MSPAKQHYWEIALGGLTACSIFSGALQVSLFLLAHIPPRLGAVLFLLVMFSAAAVFLRRVRTMPLDTALLVCAATWFCYLAWACMGTLWSTSLHFADDKLFLLFGYSSALIIVGLLIGYVPRACAAFRFTVIGISLLTIVALAIATHSGSIRLAAARDPHGALALFTGSYQSITACFGLASAFALVRILARPLSRHTLIWAVLWAAPFMAMLASGGRGAAVGAVFAQFAILVLACFKRRDGPSKGAIVAIVALLPIGAAGAFLLALQLGLRTVERLAYSFSSSSDTTHRLVLWHAAQTMADQFPVFGAGLGTFEATANNVEDTSLYPHNMFLEVLAESGAVGFVLIVAAVFLPVLFVLVRIRNIDFESLAMWLAFFAMAIFEAAVSGTVTNPDIALSIGLGIGTAVAARQNILKQMPAPQPA